MAERKEGRDAEEEDVCWVLCGASVMMSSSQNVTVKQNQYWHETSAV